MRIQHFSTIMLVKSRSWRHWDAVLFSTLLSWLQVAIYLLKSFKFELVRHGSNTCLTFGSFSRKLFWPI